MFGVTARFGTAVQFSIRLLLPERQPFTGPPKRRKSKAPVPVIAPLAQLLNMYRESVGNPVSGYIFAGSTGRPMNLHNLARRVIQPKLKEIGMEWRGWHAFRRGLATNLNRLAVSDKTIQAILRHADLSTTMNSYVKSVAADSRAAMVTLEKLICTQYAPMLAKVGTAAGVN